MLPNGMDIAIVIIIGIFAFLGWKKGMMKMGFRLLSHLASLILAWIFHPFLAEILRTTSLYESLFASALKQTETSTELPEIFSGVTSAIGNAVAGYLADLLLNGIAFLLVFLLAKVAVFLLSKVLNFVASLPILGFFNRLGGITIGLVEGLLVVWILLAILVAVPTFRENKALGYEVEQSVVARSLYLNNPILNAIMPKEEAIEDEDGEDIPINEEKELEE